ncbi:hypothetical protein PO002_33545 [Cupriavidus necator]|uniref:hypothetical protein n=1 Tax=Cupriavidus necator TaxID=106590 RepID=UPI0039C0F036
MNHNAAWQTAQPLWARFGATSALGAVSPDQARPALLRFDSDEYMDQVLAALEHDPASLGDRIARPETWRLPPGELPDLVERSPLPKFAKTLARLRKDAAPRSAIDAPIAQLATKENGVDRTLPLKLYQPAHQRYYLVAANLVCAQPGLPDRALATGGSEQVGFVLRRLLPPSAGSARVEYAFVKDASGARWQRVAAADRAMVPGEELLPLFSMAFTADNGQRRRLHAGMVPVGRREEYMGTRAQHVAGGVSSAGGGIAATPSVVSSRKEQFKMDVSEPWKNLVRAAVYAKGRIVDQGDGSGTDADRADQAARTNQQLQGQSWLVLLDFADYLATHLPAVWIAVQTPALGASLTGAAKVLFDWLNGGPTQMGTNWPGLSDSPGLSLREALRRVRGARAGLEGSTVLYPDAPGSGLAWPNFSYLLAGIRGSGIAYSVTGLHTTLPVPATAIEDADFEAAVPKMTALQQEAEQAAALVDKAVQLVVPAIDTTQPAAPSPAVPFAARLRDAFVSTPGDEGWFVIRCAYVRCDCGPLRPTLLSAPTVQFQLASFFDPDAPARPIRIALPMDTTPAGLRKHTKNAAFMMSDVLCGQVQRAKGLGFVDLVRSVLPWPLHKPLDLGGMGPCGGGSPQVSLGMICSLSLPIITICALILLMIIVSLLDLIFRWRPYFALCFPVPKFKGKGGES